MKQISNFKFQISKKIQIAKFQIIEVWGFSISLNFDPWCLNFKRDGDWVYE
jgi:hypothetical protein